MEKFKDCYYLKDPDMILNREFSDAVDGMQMEEADDLLDEIMVYDPIGEREIAVILKK